MITKYQTLSIFWYWLTRSEWLFTHKLYCSHHFTQLSFRGIATSSGQYHLRMWTLWRGPPYHPVQALQILINIPKFRLLSWRARDSSLQILNLRMNRMWWRQRSTRATNPCYVNLAVKTDGSRTSSGVSWSSKSQKTLKSPLFLTQLPPLLPHLPYKKVLCFLTAMNDVRCVKATAAEFDLSWSSSHRNCSRQKFESLLCWLVALKATGRKPEVSAGDSWCNRDNYLQIYTFKSMFVVFFY